MATIEIRKVSGDKDRDAFINFPWKLHADDPNWVPNLVSNVRSLVNQEKHPSWQYMDGDYFLAYRGGDVVGTIAAFVNHRHNEFAGENVAWFGKFDTIDDAEVAQALLDTAAEWASSRGYDSVRGPATFTLHEECGVLVDNFSPPVVLMPYNPPYYDGLIKAAGYTTRMNVQSVYFSREMVKDGELEQRLKRIVDFASKRYNFTVRPMDMRRKDAEFKIFRDLYNAAWADNWGFVPMTDDELEQLVDDLGQLIDARLAFFAEVDGEPAGFVISVPDFNEALKHSYPRPGVPEIWTLLKTLYYWRIKKVIRGARMPLLGVLKQYRNRGIDTALVYETIRAMVHSTDYQYIDCGWVLETNPLLDIVDKYGGKRYKTHRFYEKDTGK